MNKWLECITCDKEFVLNETFLAHVDANGTIDCSQCMNCVERIGASDVPEKTGGWAVLTRKLEHYIINNLFKR